MVILFILIVIVFLVINAYSGISQFKEGKYWAACFSYFVIGFMSNLLFFLVLKAIIN